MSRPLRFSALANRPGFGGEDPVTHVTSRARQAEASGFDLVSISDWVVGDVVPPLILAAQQTDRIGLMTRIVCAYDRSPVLLASLAAWVDQLSGGRFTLGLGASLRFEAEGIHGEPFDHPAPRMADIVRIIRGLWGEDVPGVERHRDGTISYQGQVVSVRGSSVDWQPRHRVPILLAAGGRHMLRVAGAWCDGVILERVSPRHLDYCLEQIAIGARSSGRSLDGFEVLLQGGFTIDPSGTGTAPAVRMAIRSHISYCHYPEWQATHELMGLGDAAIAVREAVAAGDQARAEAIVLERFMPELNVLVDPRDPAPFWRWLDTVRAKGVTILALPNEIGDTLGITLDQIRTRP